MGLSGLWNITLLICVAGLKLATAYRSSESEEDPDVDGFEPRTWAWGRSTGAATCQPRAIPGVCDAYSFCCRRTTSTPSHPQYYLKRFNCKKCNRAMEYCAYERYIYPLNLTGECVNSDSYTPEEHPCGTKGKDDGTNPPAQCLFPPDSTGCCAAPPGPTTPAPPAPNGWDSPETNEY